ncbi:MAG: type II toxin-antitoxin system VapC family toxin [Chloroflexota bacterium]|nr:type II toxin-antitoxin system VapC family toxin [Chloroflexota bacterium]
MAYYLDTSALVKRYAQETGTSWVINLTDPAAGHDIYIVRIAGPELIAALFRKVRTREISQVDAGRAAANFKIDFRAQYQITEVTTSLANRAMELAEKHGLRGYDAVHLAAAVELHTVRERMKLFPLVFISADNDLNMAAHAEELVTDDPNTYS